MNNTTFEWVLFVVMKRARIRGINKNIKMFRRPCRNGTKCCNEIWQFLKVAFFMRMQVGLGCTIKMTEPGNEFNLWLGCSVRGTKQVYLRYPCKTMRCLL